MRTLKYLTLAIAMGLTGVALANPVGGDDICETRVDLTAGSKARLAEFYRDLNDLDRFRKRNAKAPSPDYAVEFQSLVAHYDPLFTQPAERDRAAEFILFEEFKESLYETVGLHNRQFNLFQNFVKTIELSDDPREQQFSWAKDNLESLIVDTLVPNIEDPNVFRSMTNARANARLRAVADSEQVVVLLNLVSMNLMARLKENSERVQDRLSEVRQFAVSGLSAVGIVGTMAVSSVVVETAGAALGPAGLAAAGCAIGAAGGGSAAILQAQYDLYAEAYGRSRNRHTAFSCELREEMEGPQRASLIKSAETGFGRGLVAGCALGSVALVFPKTVLRNVMRAVVVATTSEAVYAGQDAVHSMYAYYVYASLMKYRAAEKAVHDNKLDKARFELAQSRYFAQAAGAHALNSILTGLVLVGVKVEMAEALEKGRASIIALVSKSSDNAAVALSIFTSNN